MRATAFERELIARELRDAFAAAQVTQDAFAHLLGTSRPRLSAYLRGKTMPSAALHHRVLRLGSSLESARRHGWMTPDLTAEVVNAALAEADEVGAFKLVVQARDHVAEMLDLQDSAHDAWLLRGRQIADPRYDALLAALIQHEFDKRGQWPTPEWPASAQIDVPWVLANERRGRAWTRKHTPRWLAERGIFVSEHDLMTA